MFGCLDGGRRWRRMFVAILPGDQTEPEREEDEASDSLLRRSENKTESSSLSETAHFFFRG